MNQQVFDLQKDQGEDVPWLNAGSVPAAPYYDPEYFELERKAVFMKTWMNIGHVCEIPEAGSFIRREIEYAKASLLIVRGQDGEIRAFHNVCTHRGTQLVAEASGRKSNFSCPYHMWTFGGDGALVSAPDFEAFGLKKEECNLRQVKIDQCGGILFVNFDPDAQPLREFLGDYAQMMENMPIAQATGFSEYTYTAKANWKLIYDNFQEHYHLRFIHPRSAKAGYGGENPFGYPIQVGFNGPHRTEKFWTNPEPTIPPFQQVGMMRAVKSAAARGLMQLPHARDYLLLFPNLFMLGVPFQNFVHMIYPTAAGESRGVVRIYWVGDDANASERFGREYIMANLRDVHTEDVSVIEAGQRGLNSGALDVIRFQRMESLCRHLFMEVDSRVQAYKQAEGIA